MNAKKRGPLVFALTYALGAFVPAAANAAEMQFGMAPVSFDNAPIYVAEDAGFFKKEGLNVSGEVMSGSSVEAAATIAGNLPFYVGLPQTAALAIARGEKQLKPFAQVLQQFPEDIVVSKEVAQQFGLTPNTPVEKRLEVLKGLRIAAWSPGTAPDMLIHFIASKMGWSVQHDLTILPIGPATSMIAALQNHRIDAFVFSSPSSDEAVRRLGAFILYRGARPDWKPLRSEIFNCLIGNADWLNANKQAAVSLYRALALSMNFIRNNPQATEAILHKRLGMFNAADFDAGYRNLKYLIPDSPELGPAKAARIENFVKAIDPSFDVPASQLADPEIGVLASGAADTH